MQFVVNLVFKKTIDLYKSMFIFVYFCSGIIILFWKINNVVSQYTLNIFYLFFITCFVLDIYINKILNDLQTENKIHVDNNKYVKSLQQQITEITSENTKLENINIELYAEITELINSNNKIKQQNTRLLNSIDNLNCDLVKLSHVNQTLLHENKNIIKLTNKHNENLRETDLLNFLL